VSALARLRFNRGGTGGTGGGGDTVPRLGQTSCSL